METYATWAKMFELQKYYSWIVDRFHTSTIAHQKQTYNKDYDFRWLEEKLLPLNFRIIFCTRTPESFEAAMAMSKYFAVNLDVGHFFAAGFDPIAYIEKNHAHITNLHLKDRKKDNGPNTPWGEGDTPIKPVLQLLKTKKYNIPANIEFEYKGDDSVAEVRKCFQYIKGALA